MTQRNSPSSVPPAPAKKVSEVPGPVKAETRKKIGKKPEPDRNTPTLTELKARQPRAGSFHDSDSKQTEGDESDCEGRCDCWGDANPRLTKEERGINAKPDYVIHGTPIKTAFED